MSLNTFQYVTRAIFIGGCVAVAAMLWLIPAIWHEIYYQERIKIDELIKQTPAVRSAEYLFDTDITENIIVTVIELRDRPDATLRLCRLEDHENGSFRHLYVSQIGDLILFVGGYRDSDRPKKENGEPAMWDFAQPSVDIGPDSEFKDILPFTVSTLDELIERYDAIIAYFETWPTSDNRGTIRLPGGDELQYYVQKQE